MKGSSLKDVDAYAHLITIDLVQQQQLMCVSFSPSLPLSNLIIADKRQPQMLSPSFTDSSIPSYS